MSFEGYYQILCVAGHYCQGDAYGEDPTNEDWVCPTCGGECAWWNMVDVTNGSWDEDNNRIDNYIELEIKEPAKMCTCKTCGVEHVVKETTYKIPKNKGHKIPNPIP